MPKLCSAIRRAEPTGDMLVVRGEMIVLPTVAADAIE